MAFSDSVIADRFSSSLCKKILLDFRIILRIVDGQKVFFNCSIL